MQFLMTTLAMITGMTFSLAIALLAEELIFGKVLGRFFIRPTRQNQTAPPVSGAAAGGPGPRLVACPPPAAKPADQTGGARWPLPGHNIRGSEDLDLEDQDLENRDLQVVPRGTQ